MFEKIMESFNQYELKARMFPALLTILPFGITILVWYPKLKDFGSSAPVLIISLVVLFALAKIAREKGKKVQSKIFGKEGQLPTTSYLKHTDNTLNKSTKNRYHIYLNKNIPNLQLPTKEQELKHPNFYDDHYASAIQWLLEKTRDTDKYPLVYQDNINYGFSRNMLGMKTLSIFFSILSIFVNLFGLYQRYHFSYLDFPLKIILSLILSLVFLIYLIFFVNKSGVRSASIAYTRTLLSTCEDIH